MFIELLVFERLKLLTGQGSGFTFIVVLSHQDKFVFSTLFRKHTYGHMVSVRIYDPSINKSTARTANGVHRFVGIIALGPKMLEKKNL